MSRFYKFYFIIAIILISFGILGCTKKLSDEEILTQKIKLYSDDNFITYSERDSLKSFINKLKNRPQIIENIFVGNLIDEDKLTELIKNILKTLGKSDVEIYDPLIKQKVNKISFFLDNTNSMAGYIRGHTHFKDALGYILGKAESIYGRNKIYLHNINSGGIFNVKSHNYVEYIYSIGTSDQQIPVKATSNEGDIYNTELTFMFKNILDSLSENDICIFISDCIFSIKDTSQRTLNQLKNLISLIFTSKLEKFIFDIALIKLNSEFDGYYTNIKGGKEDINSIRPYYIIIFAKDIFLDDFLNDFKVEKIDGYDKYFRFFTNKKIYRPNAIILYNTDKNGKFKIDRTEKNTLALEDIEPDKNINFGFTIAVNLSSMKLEDNYICDLNNYLSEKGFKVVKVEKISEDNVDKKDIKNIRDIEATHIIKLLTEEFRKSNYDLSLKLKYDLPFWINLYNTNDDTILDDVLAGKTLGLKLLNEGIMEAYRNKNLMNNFIFNINIKILN